MKIRKKITSVVLSITTVAWLAGVPSLPIVHAASLTEAQIQSILTLLKSFGTDVGIVANVESSLRGTPVAPAPSGGCGFSRDLTVGAKGDDVTCLQNYLTSTGHFTFSGGATGYFGSITQSAVAAWQAANGVSPTAGYFGPISRSKYNSMVAAAPAPAPAPVPGVPGTPAPVPAASGTLRVEPGIHPAASLFPVNATRVPFTVLKFTAPSDQDATVSSVVVERTGLASDTAFSGVVLLDENGVQLGIAKTFNSQHQATLNEPFVVKAGTTRTMTLGGNAQTSSNSLGGQIAYLSLVSVNSSLSVAGTLPITGVGHTVNETLTIGSVTMARGALDPGTSATKRVDTKDYTFSSVRVTAGSAEKVYLRSIRWNQTGSAGVGDLANIKTYVDGTAYDTVVSSDGKYYTTTFGDNAGKGILVDKGFSKELSVKGDIVGGTLRTVDFDIAKRTDLGVVGENYGYGITPPQTGSSDPTDDSAAFSSVEDPWYDAAQVTIDVGTLLISSSSLSPAQNIAINLANQPLGSFSVQVQGEPVSVSRIGFNITLGSEGVNDDVDDITNVTIEDEDGKVVAGPVDGTAGDSANTTSSGDGSIVFTDTVTFPVGTHTYFLKGKIGTDIDNNVTITASTTPSADFAGTVRGLISGNSITPSPTSVVALSTMTVKSGSLAISVSSVPIAQTVIAGTNQFLFSNYILDAGSSGEDVRVSGFPVEFNLPSSSTDLSNCKLYDGATVVSDVVNPTGAASSTNFTLSGGGLVVAKGTAKTISIKCDVGTGATGNVSIGYDSSSNPAPVGVTSGQDITETENDGEGQRMTFATGGTLTVRLDPATPNYRIVAAGATNVELSRIRFEAANEDIDLKQVALQMSGTASNTPVDLVGRKVTLWDGATQIGEAVFSVGDFATSSAITGFRVPRDGSKTLIVKGDIAAITNSGPLTASGDLARVDYDGDNEGLNGSYGTGVSSGSTITPAADDTSSDGVRIFKTYPTFERVSISSALVNGVQPVLRWKVTAGAAGDLSIGRFTLRVATTSATAANLNVFVFSDSAFSTSVSVGGRTDGSMLNEDYSMISWTDSSEDIGVDPQNSAGATTTLVIPAGVTRYFEARVSMTGVDATGDSISTQLQGDGAFPSISSGTLSSGNGMSSSTPLLSNVETNDDFIWSPHSTTTVVLDSIDWTNGYSVPGLPSTNMTAQVLSK